MAQFTLSKLFEEQVKKSPKRKAVTFANQSLTYVQLDRKANQLAHFLKECGAKPGSHVALCLVRSLDTLIALLAILKAGCAYVPLDNTQPEERLSFILEDNHSPVLVTQTACLQKFNAFGGKIVVLDNEKAISKQPCTPLEVIASPQDLAYVIYTSGSTGTPKGVLIEQQSVVNYCRWLKRYSGCQEGDRIDFSGNYIFDMAITTTLAPLILGLTVCIGKDEIKTGARHYLQYLKESKINIVKMTPSYFKVLLHDIQQTPITLPDIHTIILGGENLATADCAAWLEIFPNHNLHNEYGPTEATVAVTQFRVCSKNVHTLKTTTVPIGKAGSNMQCVILDKEGMLVAPGKTGELYIGGIGLARGYLNQTDLTNKKFISNLQHLESSRWYKTGDLCKKQANKVIECIGRIDSQIKIRGYRIELGEIENALMAHPDVYTAAVLARDIGSDKRIVAYYQLKPTSGALTIHQLHAHLSHYLPVYMVPSAFVQVEDFPLTANGKLDTAQLPVPQFTVNTHYVAPSSELEQALSEIWSQELGIKPIGIADNFFELGGHSLSAARIISTINNQFKKCFSLHDFYSFPTIAQLVTLMHKKKKNQSKGKSLVVQNSMHSSTILPLSDFQFMLWASNTFEPKARKLNIVARKRVEGHIDINALRFAFDLMVKKHEILGFRILKIKPAQRIKKTQSVKIIERNLIAFSYKESELYLENSMQELLEYRAWGRKSPLLRAKLFYLKNNQCELQICLPHIVADDACPDIIFSELSLFYKAYQNPFELKKLQSDHYYRHYILQENNYFNTQLDNDILFWKNYFQNVSLLTISKKYVIRKVRDQDYSTYCELQESSLNNLQKFCAKKCVSFQDGLSAVLMLALIECGIHCTQEQHFSMNIVKSTRDQSEYNNAIGCFLRLEPIKVKVKPKNSLDDLSLQIHGATRETNPFQKCSSLVKLSYLLPLRKRKPVADHAINLFIYLYAALFKSLKLNQKILNFCSQLSSFERNNQFLININVRNDFIMETRSEETIFGLPTLAPKFYRHDLLAIDNFLDVCFLRSNKSIPFIVISANLKPSFRERIAKTVCSIIESECQ